MAKLLIFRGETQLEARELTGQTVRIGRGPQNDVVLQDQGKGVSRNHAEIRFENGRYTLVDLGSQNGIWVSGTRVPSVVLEPGVPAALGPFRLMVEAPVAVAPPVPVARDGASDSAPIDPTQFVDRRAALAEAEKLGPLGPLSKKEEAAPLPREKSPAPVRKDPVRKAAPPVKVATRSGQQRPSLNARVLGGIAVLLLVAASAVIAYKVMRPRTPIWDPTPANVLIASGKCQEALDTQITPALQTNPANQQALDLRDQCNRTLAAEKVPPTPSPIPPQPPSADDRLNEAEPLLQANVVADCQKGLEVINTVLAEDANNQRAKDMAVKATACITPTTTKAGTSTVPPVDKPAVAVLPSQGGLDVIAGETDKAYKARIATARKKYDDAVAVLASQKYSQAAGLFAELMNEVPSGYLELQQKRDEALTVMRTEGKAAMDAARAADSRDNFDGAIEQLRRAHQLDPSLQVDTAIQRVTERKLARGQTRCDEGKVAYLYRDATTAIPALQDAVRLLPPSNPCVATAKEYLQKLLGK